VNQQHTIRLSSWARLVGLALLLGVGLLASLGLASGTVHAATTLTVTNCSNDSQLQADVSTANSDNANDTITFACSGAIPLTNTLTIAGSMTLDGSVQQVTLSGGGSVEVLSVNSGVSFTLNALTIAHGSGTIAGGLNNFGTVSISNSTFANNVGGDGSLFNNEFGTVSISNSTFTNNSSNAIGFGSGGIGNSGTVSISNSTFANNSGGFIGTGGIYNTGTVTISGSIVANNGGGNCSGGVSDQGYNLESGTDCGFTGTGSLQNTGPKLDPSGLQNNGGPTQTIALLSSSPAIDHIPAANCPATDQRGVSRLPGERCDIGAFEFPDTTPPTLHLPSPITVNATSPQGAVVSYTATATDDDGDALTPNCAPASGSTFPIGTATVNCSASEPGSDTAMGSFQVTVNDTDLGLTNLPTNMTLNATSPQGATVTYTPPTVVDEDSPLPPVNCTPASGSTFAIGTTTVTCTVSDSGDTPSAVSQSFTVTVNGAATQVSDLITTVNSMGLSSGLQNSLDVKLNAALKAVNAGQTATACSDLSDFIGQAQSQSGKGLTVSQANQLIAAAKQVQAVLGC
jgi:hypothetical protein